MWESFISRLTKELFTRQNSCNAPIEVFQYGIEICISTFATLFSIFILLNVILLHRTYLL